jgi:hypothetical protein
MHDMDRTQTEFWGEVDGLETGNYEYMGEEEVYGGEMEGVFDEAEEMELAAELLDVSNEAELDQFLGNLLRKASKAASKAISSPMGRALGGMLKQVAKQGLGAAGGALGNLVLPGVGGAMGSQAASNLGSMFGLELEGMSLEDQEFEVARRIVRLGGGAVENLDPNLAAEAPQAAAQAAVLTAAQQHAPGLVAPARSTRRNGVVGAGAAGGRRRGRWIRLDNGRILLTGI